MARDEKMAAFDILERFRKKAVVAFHGTILDFSCKN
jgi:hypothetical protein